MSNFRSRWISQADHLVAWTTDCVKRASTLRGDDGKRAEEEFRRAAAMSSRAGQKGETSFSIGLSKMHSLMAPRRSLSPRVYLLCNRCAIRTDDATISAPLARSGDSNSRPKLRARLARPFPRLPRFAWGREKREKTPPLSVPPLSVPPISLSFRSPSPSTTHRVPRSPRRSMLLSRRRRGGIAPFLGRVLSGLFDDGGVAAATVTRMK